MPEELEAENKELEPEGMMFVGDKGKILGGFHGEDPRTLTGQKPELSQQPAARDRTRGRGEALALWVDACKGGKPTYGDFLLAGPISDAFNLGAVSLRLGGKRLRFDSVNAKITNMEEANRHLTREYRTGWELAG